MNEVGLVAALLAQLPGPELPPTDERPAVGEPQWVQYNLDTCGSVQEVIKTASDIRMSRLIKPPHFFACDRSGEAAVIEFIGGKTVVHTGSSLAVSVLTNYTYDRCVEYLREHRGFGGERELSESLASADRFVRAALLLKQRVSGGPGKLRDYAFDVLKQTSRGKRTRHSIVWDLAGRKVYYRIYGDPGIKMIDLARLDFGGDKVWQILDIRLEKDGDLTKNFVRYYSQMNRQALDSFAEGAPEMFADVSPELTESMVTYPEKTLAANGVSLAPAPEVAR